MRTRSLALHNCISNQHGRKGRWGDNVLVERLWRSVKYEEVYLRATTAWGTPVIRWAGTFAFYNAKRRHQSLDKQTPDSVYYQDAARMAA